MSNIWRCTCQQNQAIVCCCLLLLGLQGMFATVRSRHGTASHLYSYLFCHQGFPCFLQISGFWVGHGAWYDGSDPTHQVLEVLNQSADLASKGLAAILLQSHGARVGNDNQGPLTHDSYCNSLG